MGEDVNTALQQKLENLPLNPGVYQFKDQRGSVIYVGKAKRLRNRVRSYFQQSQPISGKIAVMVSKICDLEVIVTDSEAEALILENNLIKKYQPRYNIAYRDDKSYPYVCVTRDERPRVFPTRTVIQDGNRYYGPYDHVGKMKNMLETIRQTFGLCTCACSPKMIDHLQGLPKWKKCFEDYFENCSVDMPLEEYQSTIDKVIRLLNGKTDGLIRDLKDEMEISSKALEFEKAAKLRDSIQSLEKYSHKMKMVDKEAIDRDIFALSSETAENLACGVLFKVREGKLIGSYHRFLKNIEGIEEGELLQSFMEDYYTGTISGTIPDEVHISHEISDDEPLIEYLWQQHGKKVPVRYPKIGEKAQMMRMAISNAQLQLKEYILQKQKAEKDRVPHVIKSLKRDIGLDRLPRRIECIDNSNFQGSEPVASLVCFVDGKPKKSEYKKYSIRTVTGPDDFASMREVIFRRYGRMKKEGSHLPDLLVVDGGKGQLSSGVEVLEELEMLNDIPIIGLAKRLEEVFIPGKSDPIMIPKTSSSLKLLQYLRDEAHRFAISFHRQKRSKSMLKSSLTEIPGVGPKKAQKLITDFGSVKRIREADLETLQKKAGRQTGEQVYSYFHQEAE